MTLSNGSMHGDRLDFASATDATSDEGNFKPSSDIVTALSHQRFNSAEKVARE
jgi:hypothetical protein